MRDITPNKLSLSSEILRHTSILSIQCLFAANLHKLLNIIITSHLGKLVTPHVTPDILKCDVKYKP